MLPLDQLPVVMARTVAGWLPMVDETRYVAFLDMMVHYTRESGDRLRHAAGVVVDPALREFFAGLAREIGPVDDVATLLERGLVAGRRRLAEHEVLQHALEVEADEVVPQLASVMPAVLAFLRRDLAGRLAIERLRPGVDPEEAADVLSRLALSLIGTHGAWDLDDPAEVGTDPAYALRTATGKYRTTPLRGLWQHPPYFHDGSAPDLLAVVNHYDRLFGLNLTAAQKADLVEFLKSL